MNGEPLQNLSPLTHVKLHHIGYVVSSIQESSQPFSLALGVTWDGNIVFDPIQGVRVAFFQGRSKSDPLIEFVEPGEPTSPVTRFLERGGGLHHLCYEVGDLDSHLTFCRPLGVTVIRRPVPAVAFGGRRIAWAVTKRGPLLEFLES
jgi:methylmalonyl-CoA/ethylmalonyl-CoA epimerase